MKVSFARYLRERIPALVLVFIFSVAEMWLVIHLSAGGRSFLAVCAAALPLSAVVIVFYMRYRTVKNTFESLDRVFARPGDQVEPGLFVNLVNKSERMENQIAADFCNKLIISVKKENADTIRENANRFAHIDQWTHDIKNPLAAIRLLCENNPSELSQNILMELDIAGEYVEKTLTISKALEKNSFYKLKPTPLKETVHAAVIRNKNRLIPNRIAIRIQNVDMDVYTCGRWLEYIIHQVLVNSINYRRAEDAVIEIYTENTKEGLSLVIWDNGVGIKADEIDYVFREGFIGSNDVNNRNATGIGLYLCAKIATMMDIKLKISSEYGKYTKMSIIFPEIPEE